MRRFWAGLFVALAAGGAFPVAAAAPLMLDGTPAQAVWPAVSVRVDSAGDLTLAQVLEQPQRFARAEGTTGNLGRVAKPVWLRFTVFVPATKAAQRVLEIDYPALNRIDVHLVRPNGLLETYRLGNEQRLVDRPLHSRTHAVGLSLDPGPTEVLLRVVTTSAMALPITLRTTDDFTAQESGTQLLLGGLAGLALCMMVYSLAHWIGVRDSMFGAYAILVGANLLFTLTNFGIGAQYLWPNMPALSMRLSPILAMVAAAAGTIFLRRALDMDQILPRLSLFVRALCGITIAVVAVSALGLIGYPKAQLAATWLGLISTLAVLPAMLVRARLGDHASYLILFGWVVYLSGALMVVGVVSGKLEPTLWTQLTYPVSNLIEMSAWMGVLGVRVQTIRRRADRVRLEAETLRTLAHSDALTGLPNRRGLQTELALALHRCTPDRLLALYLLDLDGFKLVNDRYGHDVGDAVLVAAGRRMREQLRGADVVARLGGDEFVVLAGDLADEGAAAALGQKLLAAFDVPFDAAVQHCEVGLTIGYALAPHDAASSDDLIKRADAAMYAGKQAGRRSVNRGGRSLVAM